MNKKMKNLKKGKQPVAPVAGPSRLKQPPVPETKPSVIDQSKEKSKTSGKIEFFKAKPKETKGIKKEEPAKKESRKMFFTKAPSPAPSVASEKVELEPPTV
jgi:DNA polymerase delta subunit 3